MAPTASSSVVYVDLHSLASGSPFGLDHIDVTQLLPITFTILFGIWFIFTVIVTYHWFRYRHQSWFAVPLVSLHLALSGWIILFMVSGFH